MRKRDGFWMLAAYLLAIALSYSCLLTLGGLPLWSSLLIADIVGTCVVFGFSLLLNNSSMYDPYWSVAPIFIGLLLLWQTDNTHADIFRQLLALNLVIIWGVRLTYNFFRGWQGIKHEDWRYVNLRQQFPKAYWMVSFAGIHLFPTLLVFLGCLSLIPVLSEANNPFNWLDGIATILTAGAIWLEGTADKQLHNFVTTNKTPGAIMKSGLWASSRHPNYLGEMLFWWGLYLFALAAGWQNWWCIVGPLCISLLFRFISIPMLDKRSLERRPKYDEHMQEVPMLFPKFKRD